MPIGGPARSSGLDGQAASAAASPYTRHIRNCRDAHLSSDEAAELEQFEHDIQAGGVYLSGGGLGCLSLAMTDDYIAHLLGAATAAFGG